MHWPQPSPHIPHELNRGDIITTPNRTYEVVLCNAIGYFPYICMLLPGGVEPAYNVAYPLTIGVEVNVFARNLYIWLLSTTVQYTSH